MLLNKLIQPFNMEKFYLKNESPIKTFKIELQQKIDITLQLFHSHQIEVPNNFKQMSNKRMLEYFMSRLCAKQGLHELGYYKPIKLNKSTHGNVIWPDKFTGSISHSDNMAIACVVHETQYRSVGIDIENIVNYSIYEQLKFLVLSYSELDIYFKNYSKLLTKEQFFTLVFSAKESIFKAIYQEVGYIFGFSCFEVVNIQAFTNTSGIITFQVVQKLNNKWILQKKINVNYLFEDDSIYSLTALCLTESASQTLIFPRS